MKDAIGKKFGPGKLLGVATAGAAQIKLAVEPILYSGRSDQSDKLDENRPAFFTPDESAAEWFTTKSGRGRGKILQGRVRIDKPASFTDLQTAVKAVGATPASIQRSSQYDGDNFTDYLYVKEVQQQLEAMGFDGYQDYDVFLNSEIPISVVWHPKQVQLIPLESTASRASVQIRIPVNSSSEYGNSQSVSEPKIRPAIESAKEAAIAAMKQEMKK